MTGKGTERGPIPNLFRAVHRGRVRVRDHACALPILRLARLVDALRRVLSRPGERRLGRWRRTRDPNQPWRSPACRSRHVVPRHVLRR